MNNPGGKEIFLVLLRTHDCYASGWATDQWFVCKLGYALRDAHKVSPVINWDHEMVHAWIPGVGLRGNHMTDGPFKVFYSYLSKICWTTLPIILKISRPYPAQSESAQISPGRNPTKL